MFKRRFIPVLFLKDGWMVRSERFEMHHYIGDPVSHVRRMVDWDVDELIVLDIGNKESKFSHHRPDFKYRSLNTLNDFINLIASECRIPLTFGGKMRSFEDIQTVIKNGADKVSVNTLLKSNPEVVLKAAKSFGRQAIVASVDYKIINGEPIVFCDHGSKNIKIGVLDWIKYIEKYGVGEILLNSIDRDGMAEGYDIETIDMVSNSINLPLIACGGAGILGHFYNCFKNTSASAVAAGNIFHFKENLYPQAKQFLQSKLKDIRYNL